MCGIAGIIGRTDERNRTALRRMSSAMAHRGPDGEDFWESSPGSGGWGLMLAHRRLAILDVSPAGAQPMIDPETGHVVVLNGEIYNFVELRDRLTAEGQSFQSSGDTAVMLRWLALHGCGAVAQLRGMFALAYWDVRERKLLMARDPLGIKPLYFARKPDRDGGWSLVFASEVRAILASRLLGRPGLNPMAAASIVWNGFMVAPDTAVAGIEQVMPGQLWMFDSAGKVARQEYFWSAAVNRESGPIDESQMTTAVEDSVRLHLASDVPLGVFLSGGVDSSSIANLAHRTGLGETHTFTLAFEEQEYNEGQIARRVAAAIGTRHREVVLTEGQFIAELDAALNSLDQPSFDGLNSYYMSRAVREAGFKVALVGTGGDEIFGGYTSFQDLPRLSTWSKCLKWVPETVRSNLAQLVFSVMQPSSSPVPPQTRWAKLPEVAQRGDDLLALYQLAYSLFVPDFRQQLLDDTMPDALVDGLPTTMLSRLRIETQSRSPLSAISVLELRLFLGERLLRDTDATSMAASIEMRLPLVDQVLFENVDRLPDGQRFLPPGRKSVLRRIGLRGLDPALFVRPKAGFVMPYDRWIRKSLGKLMDATMRDPLLVKPTGLNPEAVRQVWLAFLEGAPGIYWTRVWAIYVYVRWCHQTGVYL